MAEVPLLHVDGLTAELSGAEHGGPRFDGISLRLRSGETVAIIGPTGEDLAALAAVLLGGPGYRVTGGRILLRGDDITSWPTEVRAKAGLFLASPHPTGLAGVTIMQLISQAIGAGRGVDTDLVDLRATLLGWTRRFGLDPSFLDRAAGDIAAPAEARLAEMLQAAVLEPDVVILDETGDRAGLDRDVATALATGIEAVLGQRPTLGTLAITHCQRLLERLEPDHVHVMVGQRIVASGGPELAEQLETEGYESFT